MNQKALDICNELDLIKVVGSDAHEVDTIGTYAVNFPNKIKDINQLDNELKNNNLKLMKRIHKSDYIEIL